MYDIITTRHPSLVALAVERGWLTGREPLITHAAVSDVKGKHVFGVLPYHLGRHTASMTEVPLQLSEQDRKDMEKGDLPIERLREVAGEPITYEVYGGSEHSRDHQIARAAERRGARGWSKDHLYGLMVRILADFCLGERVWYDKVITSQQGCLAATCIVMAGQSIEGGPTLLSDGLLHRGWDLSSPVVPWQGLHEWSGDGGHGAAEMRVEGSTMAIRAFGSGPEWCDWYEVTGLIGKEVAPS